MNKALIYRTTGRKLTWTAFACAVTIHVVVVALAENKSGPVSLTWGSEPDEAVIGIFDPQPPQAEEVSPPEKILPAPDDDTFTQENSTRMPVRPRKKTPVTPVARLIGIGTGWAMHADSVKALTLYAPRPSYPYEARRGGITGSGIAQLTVNPEVGNVLEARMAQTTGSVVLDNATVEALRNWRFKSGVASSIQVPITYRLTGVSY